MVAAPGDTLRAQSLPQSEQRRVFRETTNLVLVDVYPQRNGRIVEGLTREDFEVFENNVPQVIEAIEFVRVEPNPSDVIRRDPNNQREALTAAADPYARVFVVFLDTSHTTSPGSHAIRRPLIDALDRLVRPDDLVGVLSQRERPTDLVLGRRLESLDDRLRQYWAWGEGHALQDFAGTLVGVDDSDRTEALLDRCFSVKLIKKGDLAEFVEWYIDDGPARRLLSEVLIERLREDRVITALENLVGYLGAIRNGRTVLMVVTDGWLWFPVDRRLAERLAETDAANDAKPALFMPRGGSLTTRDQHGRDRDDCNQELIRLASLDNPLRLRTLIDEARRRSVSIYPINPEVTAADEPLNDRTQAAPAAAPGALVEWHRMRRRHRIEGLRTLAQGTDAFAVVDTNDIAVGLQRIAEDVSAFYLLGYSSTHTELDGQYRTIRVNVKPSGLHVRARRGYRAPSAASVLAPEAIEAGDEGAEARETAFARLARVRPDAPLFTYGVLAGSEAVVTVELREAQVARASGPTPVLVELLTASGTPVGRAEGAVAPATRGALVRVPLGADREGPWRANVTVGAGRDRLQDSLVIAGRPGALVEEAVVFRATPSPRSSLVPVADFLFRRTERVHVEWTLVAELDRRQARLIGRDGRPLAVPLNVTERQIDGSASVAVDLNLAPLTQGEYAIELAVGRGTATERRVVAIRVLR